MNKVTKMFIVRHGQTEWNCSNRLQGQLDSPLTSLGISQVLEVKQKLVNKNIHIAYSSPLQRAIDTTALIVSNWPIKAVVRSDLAEMQLGKWQGKTYREVEKNYSKEFVNFMQHPELYLLPGAETYKQFQERVILEIKYIFYKNHGKNILVVSHGIAIKVIFAYVMKMKLSEIAEINMLDNGKYIRLKKYDCINIV